MPTRIAIRFSESELALIDRAADLCGRSRTDFLRHAAVRAAEEVLLDQSVVRMSPDGFEAFRTIVSAPAEVVPEMVELFRRPPLWAGR